MTVRLVRPTLALFVSVSTLALFCATPVSAALPPAGGGSSNAAVSQLVSDAQRAIKAGKLTLAVIDLKNASSADPRNGPLRAQLGKLLFQTGDFYAAERELRQARKDGASDQLVLPFLFETMLTRSEESQLLDEFPEPGASSNIAPDILKARAMAFLGLGQSGNAMSAMDKSLKLRRDASGLLVRARIAERARDLAAALKFANEAITTSQDNVDGLLFKVGLLIESNDLNGALTLANQLTTKYPANLRLQFARIEVFMRMGRTDQAKGSVDAILAKTPGVPLGIYYRALLISRTGDKKGAWRTAQSLPEEFFQSQPQIALNVSQMAEASGNQETAAAILNGAIAKFPQDATLRLRLAGIRVSQNDINGTVNALEPLKDKLDPATAETLATMYVKSSRGTEAQDILEKLARSGNETDAVALQLVAVDAQLGESDQALKDLTRAVNQKPTDAVLVKQLVAGLIGNRRFDDALSVADKLGADPAQRVTSFILRAQALVAERKLDDALASCSRALQIEPKNQAALYDQAVIFEGMGRFADAAKDLRTILVYTPQNPVVFLKLAELAERQNQDGQARSFFMDAIKASPQNPGPRIALARYLLRRNDPAAALSTVSDFVKAHPDNTEGLAMAGRIQILLGKKKEAVATFRHLAALTPRDYGAEVLLGSALFANGDRAASNAALSEAVKLAPASSDVRLAQINLLFVEKDINAAIAAAQAYQKANPGNEADILLGDALARAGRQDQAMTLYNNSFATRPNSEMLLKIAGVSIAGGNTKHAVELMSSWLGKNPGDVAVRTAYAMALMQQQNNDDAIHQFQEVLKLDPDNVISLNNIAWLVRDRDPKTAIDLASRAVALAPNSPEIIDTLGWLDLEHGKAADSLPLFQRAHVLRPQDGEISYHLALSLNATGRTDAAKGFLKALLLSKAKFGDLTEANELAQTWH